MRLLSIMLLAGALLAQSDHCIVSATIHASTWTRIWQWLGGSTIVNLGPILCDAPATEDDPMLPGESTTCTIWISPPTQSGITVSLTIPLPLMGPQQVVIPAGANAGEFVLTYPVWVNDTK